MNSFHNNLYIQQFGLYELFHVIAREDAKDALIESDAVVAIIMAMDTLPIEDVRLQCASGMAVFRILDSDTSDRTKNKILEAGGLSILIAVLKHYGAQSYSGPGQDDVVDGSVAACTVISRLARDEDCVAKAVSELGGILAIHSIIKHFASESKLQHQAMYSLCVLGENADANESFVGDGGIHTLVAKLREYPGDEEFVVGVCSAFARLAKNSHETADALALEGVLAEIATLLQKHIENFPVQFAALASIGSCISVRALRMYRKSFVWFQALLVLSQWQCPSIPAKFHFNLFSVVP